MSDPLNLVGSSAPKKANRQAKVKSTDGQPFNIGKYSAVIKADPDSLALSDENIKPTPRSGKAKGKGKKKMDELSAASDLALSDAGDEKDFAMDSEEEAAQMKKAVRASRSSVASNKGKGRAKVEKAPPQALGGRQRKGNGRALKAAVARAAESEWPL